jgi:hypothetical protein
LKIPKGNWKPYIGGQTKQWPNEKEQKYKQWLTKHYTKNKGELVCHYRKSIVPSPVVGTHRVTYLVISYERGKNVCDYDKRTIY